MFPTGRSVIGVHVVSVVLSHRQRQPDVLLRDPVQGACRRGELPGRQIAPVHDTAPLGSDPEGQQEGGTAEKGSGARSRRDALGLLPIPA